MGDSFSELLRTHPSEDDIITPLLGLGICKAVSVTGLGDNPSETSERLKRMLETMVKSKHLPTKTAALHGLLYLLQSEVLSPEEMHQVLLPLAMEYLNVHLQHSSIMQV